MMMSTDRVVAWRALTVERTVIMIGVNVRRGFMAGMIGIHMDMADTLAGAVLDLGGDFVRYRCRIDEHQRDAERRDQPIDTEQV